MSVFTDEGYDSKKDFLICKADEWGIDIAEVKDLVSGLDSESIVEEIDDLIEERLEEIAEELAELEYMD
jgi:DNA-binding transcriptional MerR regulator